MTSPTDRSLFSIMAPLPIEAILVGAALTGDEVALDAAAQLARSTGARLCVVHAMEPMEAWFAHPVALAEDLHARLEEAIRRLPAAQRVAWEVRVRPGAAHRVLDEEARRFSPDLMVVGATAGGRRALGSTAERVVRRSAAPVLVVRERLVLPPRQVVAPVDLSELSANGFHCGLDIVQRLAGACATRVLALFAIGFLDEPANEARRSGRSNAEMMTGMRARLDAFVAEHRPGGSLGVERRVVRGLARDAILDAVRREDADLVVLATHGHGGFERLVLGSVAASVVREAPCNVLLVPPIAAFGDSVAEAVLSQTSPARAGRS